MEPSELSSALRAKHDEWWQAYIGKDWRAASFLANDIEVLARHITVATHFLYEEKISADFAARHRSDPDTTLPPEASK